MKQVLSILLFFCLLTSCKKSKIEDIKTNNSSDSLSYQPAIAGSRWVYRRTVSGFGTTYDFTCTAADTTINGKTYRVFNNSADGSQYIRRDNGKYYSILTASTNKPELLIIDTARMVGESWLGGVNGSDTYTFTMKQKLDVYTLDGFTFKKVLVIHQDRVNTSGNNTLSTDTYFGRGVGQVYSTGTLSGLNATIKLITLDLK